MRYWVLSVVIALGVLFLASQQGRLSEGGILLVIGRDFSSCLEYEASGLFPKPERVTTYTNIRSLTGLEIDRGWADNREEGWK